MMPAPRRLLTLALIAAATINATTAVYSAWSQLINPGANPHLQATRGEANALPSLPVYAQAAASSGDLRFHQPAPAVIQPAAPHSPLSLLAVIVRSNVAPCVIASRVRIPSRAPPIG